MHKRRCLKTLSWRLVATGDTLIIAWFITGRWDFAATIAGVEIATKLVLYWLHDWGWEQIP